MENLLIGCMFSRSWEQIKTRFIFLNIQSGEIKDVTKELVDAINKYDENGKKLKKETGRYYLPIPYVYNAKKGLAVYPYGSGNTHYLENDCFADIVKAANDILTFPLETCRIIVYAPEDINNILECEDAFDKNIEEALLERNFSNYQSN